jgi:transposase
MGASNFTYIEATWTQALADWIGAHTRAFAEFAEKPLRVKEAPQSDLTA